MKPCVHATRTLASQSTSQTMSYRAATQIWVKTGEKFVHDSNTVYMEMVWRIRASMCPIRCPREQAMCRASRLEHFWPVKYHFPSTETLYPTWRWWTYPILERVPQCTLLQ